MKGGTVGGDADAPGLTDSDNLLASEYAPASRASWRTENRLLAGQTVRDVNEQRLPRTCDRLSSCDNPRINRPWMSRQAIPLSLKFMFNGRITYWC